MKKTVLFFLMIILIASPRAIKKKFLLFPINRKGIS